MSVKRPWKIYAIHHSHTDIGYTERQEKIQQYHVNFIRQVLHILRESKSGRRPEWQGFKWVCETFWPIETFLKQATEQEKIEFAEGVRQGDIGLSGTYLNMTELIGKELFQSMIARVCDYGQSIQIPVTSAMTADINGFSWGYGQVLLDAGIQNLSTCIHTHHGMFPCWKKQQPFWWEMPSGDRLLTWSGEHYVFGNDLGLVPGMGGKYTIKDEFDMSKGADFEIAEQRIERYIDRLEQDGYAFDFFPAMFSGLPTDNNPPNAAAIEFIQQWNAKHGERIVIQMATLDDFFAEVRAHSAQHPEDIPVYRGDWPDWWTDGVGSTPKHVQVFREAQRVYQKVRRLDPNYDIISPEAIKEMEYQLTMFAEHTWGYHSSISEPWNPFVQELGLRKEAFAANASTAAHRALYEILEAKGDALLAPGRPMKFKICNPYSYVQEDHAHLILEGWYYEQIKEGFEVRDFNTGEVLPSQLRLAHRGVIVTIPVMLEPQEEKVLHIVAVKPTIKTAYMNDYVASDRVLDLDVTHEVKDFHVTSTYAETPFVRIEWKKGEGITSWKDKETGQELLRADRNHHAFTPVYDVTPATKVVEMTEVRRLMGRNRKGPNAIVSTGVLTSAEIVGQGELYSMIQLTYEVSGCEHYSLFLTVYADRPRVDVSVRMHKESVWKPENLYISLPFGGALTTSTQELWVDKMDALTRLRKDQLPGSLADYTAVGEGAAYISKEQGIVIAMPDTPLIQVGALEHKYRLLNGDARLEQDPAHLYAWVMNNYWETNFAATLGGFYEFRYYIAWGEKFNNPEVSFDMCRGMNAGILAWRQF